MISIRLVPEMHPNIIISWFHYIMISIFSAPKMHPNINISWFRYIMISIFSASQAGQNINISWFPYIVIYGQWCTRSATFARVSLRNPHATWHAVRPQRYAFSAYEPRKRYPIRNLLSLFIVFVISWFQHIWISIYRDFHINHALNATEYQYIMISIYIDFNTNYALAAQNINIYGFQYIVISIIFTHAIHLTISSMGGR